MKVMRGTFALSTIVLSLLGATSVLAKSDASDVKKSTLNDIKTVWVILMENHNWTGNNAGAAFGVPDIKADPSDRLPIGLSIAVRSEFDGDWVRPLVCSRS